LVPPLHQLYYPSTNQGGPRCRTSRPTMTYSLLPSASGPWTLTESGQHCIVSSSPSAFFVVPQLYLRDPGRLGRRKVPGWAIHKPISAAPQALGAANGGRPPAFETLPPRSLDGDLFPLLIQKSCCLMPYHSETLLRRIWSALTPLARLRCTEGLKTSAHVSSAIWGLDQGG